MNVRSVDVEIVADYRNLLGEGPLWHAGEKRLYWTDILGGKIYRYDPASGDSEEIYEGETVGGFTFQEAGGLLLFGARGSVRHYDDGLLAPIIREIESEQATRFNDVIADPAGRVFVGTIPVTGEAARLYRLDANGAINLLADDIGLSNGFAFSPDHSKLYYTDSGTPPIAPNIFVYDYDQATGALSNQAVFADLDSADGIPDGMTVDEDGGVWSARWGGGCVIRYRSDGVEDYRILLPARAITSCVFGGDDLQDLYITSAGGDTRGSAESGPMAGALFRVRPGVCGLPEHHSRVSKT